MKKSIAMICMGLAGSVFAADEYLPVAKGAIEIDLGYGLIKPNGDFDTAGEKQDLPPGVELMRNAIPLQIKYGIIPGLDVELMWAFGMNGIKDTSSGIDTTLSGFGQPEICLKYALMDIGVGAHVNFALPFATGDFAEPVQPPMALTFGVLYTKLFVPQFNLTAIANYTLNFEADSAQFIPAIKAGNVISILAKPEFRFNQFGGAYLGLKYDMWGESEAAGTAQDDAGNLFTLLPGWNATWTPMISTELNIPYTVLGKNSNSFSTAASWGINLWVYVTLGI